MAKRCFSSQQLYTLRNDIAVEVLIEKELSIPCRIADGCFRFLCPLCSAFDTAVNPKTNLARCFRCGKNFNTIDLVMLIRRSDFVKSIRFLQKFYRNSSVGQLHGNLETIAGSNPQDGSRMERETPSGKSGSGPCRIVKILGTVMPSKPDGFLKTPDVDCSTKQKKFAHQRTDNERILKLEQKIEYLGRQIEKISETINVGLPSK